MLSDLLRTLRSPPRPRTIGGPGGAAACLPRRARKRLQVNRRSGCPATGDGRRRCLPAPWAALSSARTRHGAAPGCRHPRGPAVRRACGRVLAGLPRAAARCSPQSRPGRLGRLRPASRRRPLFRTLTAGGSGRPRRGHCSCRRSSATAQSLPSDRRKQKPAPLSGANVHASVAVTVRRLQPAFERPEADVPRSFPTGSSLPHTRTGQERAFYLRSRAAVVKEGAEALLPSASGAEQAG